jgi:hypothetical protein
MDDGGSGQYLKHREGQGKVNLGEIAKRTPDSGTHRERGSAVVAAASNPVMWAVESIGDMYTWQHSAMGKLMVCSTWKKSSPKIEKRRVKHGGDQRLMTPWQKKKQGEGV